MVEFGHVDGCMNPDCEGHCQIERDALERLHARAKKAEAEVEQLTKELDARKVDPVTRLHNICRGLGEPMECGHAVDEWCDVCQTCGACHEEAKRDPRDESEED